MTNERRVSFISVILDPTFRFQGSWWGLLVDKKWEPPACVLRSRGTRGRARIRTCAQARNRARACAIERAAITIWRPPPGAPGGCAPPGGGCPAAQGSRCRRPGRRARALAPPVPHAPAFAPSRLCPCTSAHPRPMLLRPSPPALARSRSRGSVFRGTQASFLRHLAATLWGMRGRSGGARGGRGAAAERPWRAAEMREGRRFWTRRAGRTAG